MTAKIVFRGNKCFREFDLKTVAEKLGLSSKQETIKR